jgi:hypothetical protein
LTSLRGVLNHKYGEQQIRRAWVMAKLLCHNICCLIAAIYELGIDPVFWEQQLTVAG